jgi:outer membrane immunogenic protein
MRTAISAAAALFLASTAVVSAADLAVKARPYAPVAEPVYTWTGFYVGANAGLGGDKVDYPISALGGTADLNLTSFGGFGGGQVGYNYQFGGNWVAGVEADIQGTNMKSRLAATIGPVSLSAGTEMKYFGTVRGRLGYAYNNILLYATGGYAYGSEDTTLSAAPLVTFSRRADLSGWTAGGGVEWAANNNWSFKTEYLYLRFDRNNVFSAAPVFVIDDKVAAHTLKFGVNYRFGGPVVARY